MTGILKPQPPVLIARELVPDASDGERLRSECSIGGKCLESSIHHGLVG